MFARIAAACVIALLILTGCGNAPTGNNTETSGSNVQVTQTATPEVSATPEQSETPTPSATPAVTATPEKSESPTPSASPAAVYKDGVYEGKSPLTSEAYYGKVDITVKDGKITDVKFAIYDTNWFKQALPASETKGLTEKLMDEEYGKTVFADTPMYQDQVTNELKGIAQYETVLKDTQDISEVDVMSKATWSWNIYKDAVNDALKSAKN